MIEDELVGWHHQLNEHEFEPTLGDSEGQGKPGVLQSMAGWGHKELDMNNDNKSPNDRST